MKQLMKIVIPFFCRFLKGHAFISSRLDYCNVLYSGISKRNLQRLQLIQNAAARLLTEVERVRKYSTQVKVPLH